MIFPSFARSYWKQKVGVSFECSVNMKTPVSCLIELEDEIAQKKFVPFVCSS